MPKKKTPKTLPYYVCDDTSALRREYDAVVRENLINPKVSNLYALLAERVGIRLGVGFLTADPLKRVLEGESIKKKSADIIADKTGLVFREIRKVVPGRPRKVCALEDMVKNGARVGIVPSHAMISRGQIHLAHVAAKIREALSEHDVTAFEVNLIANRHVPSCLQEGFHFVVGATETPESAPFLETVCEIHEQRLGILSPREPSGKGRIAVLVGTAEEAIVRSLNLDEKTIAVDFGDSIHAYAKLFEAVKDGEFKAAFANALAVNNWLALQSGQLGGFLETFNAEVQDTPMSDTEIFTEPDHGLIMVKHADIDQWLRSHSGYQGDEAVNELSFLLSIAVAKQSPFYKFKPLKKLLSRPIPPAPPRPIGQKPELPLIFKLAGERVRRQRREASEQGKG